HPIILLGRRDYSGRLTVNQGSDYHNPGQKGPLPPNSDPKVPLGSTSTGCPKQLCIAGKSQNHGSKLLP
ncbi:DNAse I-like superfamily protein, partial [Prunus dulcis]